MTKKKVIKHIIEHFELISAFLHKGIVLDFHWTKLQSKSMSYIDILLQKCFHSCHALLTIIEVGRDIYEKKSLIPFLLQDTNIE